MLEAAMMVLTGRPLRPVTEGILIKKGETAAALKAQIDRKNGFDVVEIRLTTQQKKITINGHAKTAKALPGIIAVSVFSPMDLVLVQGSPQERRRFLDQETAAIDPSYIGLWQRYHRVLWQKNIALAKGHGKSPEGRVWDEQLAFYGARLITSRNRWLTLFRPILTEVYRKIAPKNKLTIEISPSFTGAGSDNPETVERSLADALTAQGARTGPLAVGPHRDDLLLRIDGRSVRYASSQGEQRTAVLALRLAGHVLRRNHLGENPVFLLDDALHELDSARQERLLEQLQDGSQVMITAHHSAGTGRIFRVAGGNIIEQDQQEE